jgi:hypothetical protein
MEARMLSPLEQEQLDRIEQDLAASWRTAWRMSERRWRRGLVNAVMAIAATDLDSAAIAATGIPGLPGKQEALRGRRPGRAGGAARDSTGKKRRRDR